MSWIAAALSIGSSLIGQNKQKKAADRAADITAKSTDAATALQRRIHEESTALQRSMHKENTALQRRMYEEGVARQQPFYQAGVNELPNYLKGIQPGGDLVRGFTGEDFQQYQDPGYGFRLNEGLKALQGSAAARGGLLSGNTLRGISDYSQQAASQEYGNAYARFIGEQATRRNALAGLVGQGQSTANTIGTAGSAYGSNVGAAGSAYGSNVGNALMGQGENRANASLYGANAQAQAIRNIGSVASDYFR